MLSYDYMSFNCLCSFIYALCSIYNSNYKINTFSYITFNVPVDYKACRYSDIEIPNFSLTYPHIHEFEYVESHYLITYQQNM